MPGSLSDPAGAKRWLCWARPAALGSGIRATRSALAQGAGDNVLTEALVLRDPDIPTVGNAEGDINIVEYFDYQCPYCRKIEPELRQVVQDDGKVRLVWKDWPILGPISVVASRMALATRYQDKYREAHATGDDRASAPS